MMVMMVVRWFMMNNEVYDGERDDDVCEAITEDIPAALSHALKDGADAWMKSEELQELRQDVDDCKALQAGAHLYQAPSVA